MRRDQISKHFDYRWLFTSMHLHHYISYRYDEGSTNQLKDGWESEGGVMVFSPGDDAIGFLFG